eukprot:gene10075-12350_t
MVLVGGIKDVKPVDADAHTAANAVREQALTKLSKSSTDVFEPVSYATQVVAGTNFFIKVKVGSGEYVHLRVFRDFSNNHSLHSLQSGKTETDPIEYF